MIQHRKHLARVQDARRIERRLQRAHQRQLGVGGTFTDVVVAGGGRLHTLKVSSTPDDYSRAILTATRRLRDELGVYDLQYEKPPPLVPRRHRHEVAERLGARGEVCRPLDEAEARRVAERLAAEGIEAVAVCFLNSYVDGRHEQRMVQILREQLDRSVYICASADILPEIREYERTSTAVVNAYTGPVVRHYLDSHAARLRDAGVRAPLHIMQSNGGTMSAAATVVRPVS